MILNVAILITETIYYSLFMHYIKGNNNFFNYIKCFALVTIVGMVINTNYLISYFILMLLILLSMKYIAKDKLESYDMFSIFLMLFFKIIIEYTIVLIFYNLLKLSIPIVLIIIAVGKLFFIYILENRIRLLNRFFHKLWINNNFYIRYIFTILMFIYVIISCITVVLY